MMDLPITSFGLQLPEDGLPILPDWLATAANLFSLGYESWREVVEVKEMGPDFGTVLPSKGFTRISIILFGLSYTFKSLQKQFGNADDPELVDFQRCTCQHHIKSKPQDLLF